MYQEFHGPVRNEFYILAFETIPGLKSSISRLTMAQIFIILIYGSCKQENTKKLNEHHFNNNYFDDFCQHTVNPLNCVHQKSKFLNTLSIQHHFIFSL